MRLSTKARYGARAMLDLAMHYREKPVLLKDVAKRHHISSQYLEHIMTSLVSGGLVHGLRGKQGGFSLAKPPQKIKLSEIVKITEGSIAPVQCVDNPKICNYCKTCVTHDIWKKMKEAMISVLDSYTLNDMVEMHRKKTTPGDRQMYYI